MIQSWRAQLSAKVLIFQICLFTSAILPDSLLANPDTSGNAINKALDLEQLIKTHEVTIVTRRDNEMIYADASVVLNSDADNLLATITKYNQYVEWGMPALKQCRLLQQNGNQFTTWSWIGLFGYASKHCLQISKVVLKANHAGYVNWQLTPCPKQPSTLPKELVAAYKDAPAFKSVRGGIYVENIHRDGAPKLVYLRYSLAVKVQSFLPSGLVFWVARTSLKSDIVKVIRILDRESKQVPSITKLSKTPNP